MSKKTKIWLIIATFLVVIGLIIFAVVMSACNWDFTKLNTAKYETNTIEINDEFTNITINSDTADIVFMLSEDDSCKVVCYEQEKTKHNVTVKDNALTVSFADTRKWYEYLSFNLHSAEITVYLPKTEYDSLVISETTGDVTLPNDFTFKSADIKLRTGHINSLSSCTGQMRIETKTGNINLQELSAGEINLTVTTGKIDVRSVMCKGEFGIKVSTGDTTLTDIFCKSIKTYGGTGDTTFKNVIAEELINIKCTTGEVNLEACDAAELDINTDTGDVTGSLMSSKVFIAHSDTGHIEVPETTSGGKCKITTDTGDIRINVE